MNRPNIELETLHLRIMFGPLFGSDIEIAGGEIFFCVGDPAADDRKLDQPEISGEHALGRAVNTLYIPYRASQPNFRLRRVVNVTDESENSGEFSGSNFDYEVDFLSDDFCETRNMAFNTVCRYGDIAFAVKPLHDAWSDEVSQFARESAPEVLPLFATRDDHYAPPPERPHTALKLGALLLTGVALVGFAYWQIKRFIGEQHLETVSSVLANAPGTNTILPGEDGRIYVLNPTQDGAEWDREALLKAVLPEKVSVVETTVERQRLERQLNDAGLDFVTVRLDTPAHPELIVTEDTTPAATTFASRALRSAAPYIKDVRVLRTSLATIEQDARDALDKAGARYRRLARTDGATFEVATSIGDEELISLQKLTRSFGQKWGKRRVDFKIALRTDWLKGKSYQEGGNGYVLLNHTSWYFPQPVEGARSR